MRKTCKLIIFSGLACFLALSFHSDKGWTQNSKNQNSGNSRLQQRIDFGNAYIMGQSIKSGAVYLLHRKQSDIKSMLQYREDYRQEILEDFVIREDKTENTQLKGQDSGM